MVSISSWSADATDHIMFNICENMPVRIDNALRNEFADFLLTVLALICSRRKKCNWKPTSPISSFIYLQFGSLVCFCWTCDVVEVWSLSLDKSMYNEDTLRDKMSATQSKGRKSWRSKLNSWRNLLSRLKEGQDDKTANSNSLIASWRMY